MHEYEIRIAASIRQPAVTLEEIHLSDRGAISAGRKMAKGRAFEIWRDLECIFRHAPSPPPRPFSVLSFASLIETLPVALILFDRRGAIISHSGAMDRLIGSAIPSRDAKNISRWHLQDKSGATIAPPHWPSARALRGEICPDGFDFDYAAPDSRLRRLHVTAMPIADGAGSVGGAPLLQDTDPARRAADGPPDVLEQRFVMELFSTLTQVLGDPQAGGALLRRVIRPSK